MHIYKWFINKAESQENKCRERKLLIIHANKLINEYEHQSHRLHNSARNIQNQRLDHNNQ